TPPLAIQFDVQKYDMATSALVDSVGFTVDNLMFADAGNTTTITSGNAAGYDLDWSAYQAAWIDQSYGTTRLKIGGISAFDQKVIQALPHPGADWVLDHIDVQLVTYSASQVHAIITTVGNGTAVPEPANCILALLAIVCLGLPTFANFL